MKLKETSTELHTALRKATLAATVLSAGFLGLGGTAHAQSAGQDNGGVGISNVAFGSLAPVVTETGFISWSLDGMGTTAASGTIRVQKPAGATTRRAFLGSASTGFSGRKLANGDVTVDGSPISWDISTVSSISSWNHWAEITSLVKAKIDAAPAGIINFTVGEVNSLGIDGEALAVIFDDPNQTTVNTVVFLFGAQSVGGDTFNIGLSNPIDKTDPNLKLDLSLGISFGFQGSTQFSIVDVDGTQMTTSAGGQDDGQDSNGSLITVGGIGDTDADPNPTALPTGPRSDDELYSLLPFVTQGDTTIKVFTKNPSNDDNIFFAGLFVADAAAVVGEGIVLGPGTGTLNVGQTATATATVQDSNGNPVANRAVTFTVTEGPNMGQTATVNTDATGHATFSYVGSGGTGEDLISATFVTSNNVTKTSNTVFRTWITTVAPKCALTATIAGPPKQLQITVQSSNAGIQSVVVTESANATVTVPAFPQGDKLPLVVTATKINQAAGSNVALSITDVNGLVTNCDPVVPGDSASTDSADSSGPGLSCSIGPTSKGTGLFGGLAAFGLAAVLGGIVRRRRSRK
jgi:hypothetical protein